MRRGVLKFENRFGLVPGLDAPVAFGTAPWDFSKGAANVLDQTFTPDASQAATVDDGSGIQIKNPTMQDDCSVYNAC